MAENKSSVCSSPVDSAKSKGKKVVSGQAGKRRKPLPDLNLLPPPDSSEDESTTTTAASYHIHHKAESSTADLSGKRKIPKGEGASSSKKRMDPA